MPDNIDTIIESLRTQGSTGFPYWSDAQALIAAYREQAKELADIDTLSARLENGEVIVNREALTSIIGDLARQAMSLDAADALRDGCYFVTMDQDCLRQTRCLLCGRGCPSDEAIAFPHAADCLVAAYTATRSKGDTDERS